MSLSISRLVTFYGHLEAEALLRPLLTQEFERNEIALITSFGADSAVLLSMVAEIDPEAQILFLETGKHFPETIVYAKELQKKLGLKSVDYLTPSETMLNRTDPEGTLWKHQPNRCCWMRKVEPLERAVKERGIRALITGRKRHQTPERAALATIECEENGLIRINPLALWGQEQVDTAFAGRSLPRHPLVEQGYVSIGCAPCTLPVTDKEDIRSGRWAHTIGLDETRKTECGIHLPQGENPSWDL